MDFAESGYIDRIEKRVEPMEEAALIIVQKHIGELDVIIKRIRDMLKDETDQLTDLEIDDILLQLPIVLYDVTDDQEVVGLQSDLASEIYKEAFNEAHKLARGTIADKNSIAQLNAMKNKSDMILYDRAYKIIKQKIEMARETLNAVKKVQASRQQRYELGRFGPRF